MTQPVDRLGKILDDAFNMGKSLHPEDYANLRKGMIAQLQAYIESREREARIEEWQKLQVIDWCNLRAPEVRRLRDEQIAQLNKDREG